MVYLMTTDGQHVIVLEPESVDKLQARSFVHTPDNAVLIAATNDADWLGAQLIKHADDLTPNLIIKLIEESQQRPVVRTSNTRHPEIQVIKKGKVLHGHDA